MTLHSINFRRIDTADIKDARKMGVLFEQAFGEPYGIAAVQSFLRSSRSWAIIAEDYSVDLSAIGFVIAAMAADEVEIYCIAVDPKLQNHGVGYLLVQYLIRDAQRCKVSSFFLEVAASNRKAIALYQKCNFKAVGRRRAYYRKKAQKREDAIIFKYKVIKL